MRPLPEHWQLASAEVEHEGRRFPLRIWGWSAESAADAAMRAQHRLAAAVDQLTRGRAGFDYYPRTPVREEVLHEVRGADGALIGAVTRNRMGVEVLDTDVLHPDLGVRTYRTAAGLRVIVTGLASGPPDLTALVDLGSDDLYVRLCGLHETSRARLTPKPTGSAGRGSVRAGSTSVTPSGSRKSGSGTTSGRAPAVPSASCCR